MSGVFGILDSQLDTQVETLLASVGAKMSHREWYAIDTYIDEDIGIGLGRVGIGIFNRREQPVSTKDGSLHVFLSGEFYRTQELRRDLQANGHHLRDNSDAELLLRLYEHKKDDFIDGLAGAFVLAIWDARERRLVLANDPFGLYPTYFAKQDSRFIFAPEVKGILADSRVARTLRDDAVAEYVRFQRLLGSKTFLADVSLLPPASVLIYDYQAGVYTLRRYWEMSAVPPLPETVTFEQAVREASRLFRDAVAKRTQGPERIGVYLSGGIDGRGILGMIPTSDRTVHTFTFGQPGCRDEHYARKIARAAGAQHHYYPYEDGHWIREFADLHLRLTEGFQPWIHMHGINMLGDVRQHVDVNLSGLGDLLWIQSNFTPISLITAPDDIAFNSLLFDLYNQKYSWPGITSGEERFLFHESFYPRVRGVAFDSFMAELEPFAGLPYPQRVAAFNLTNQFSRHLLYHGVFGRSHVEYRFPYCDLELASFCYALPYKLGYDRCLQKAIISREMPALARIPYAADELPVNSRGRRRALRKFAQKVKSGIHQFILPIFPPRPTLYADYEEWLRTDLRLWAEGILFDERTLERGIFQPDALRSLMDRHLSGREEWTIGKIAPIITLEMMMRQLFDESSEQISLGRSWVCA